MSTPKILDNLFSTKNQRNWVALNSTNTSLLKGFGTQRIAKFTPENEIQFTLGATLKGRSSRLNETIIEILRSENVEILDRKTTSGSRNYEAPYPTIRFGDVNADSLARIVHRIEGAAWQARKW